MDQKNSIDTGITSPVESNNNAIKHALSTTNSRINIDEAMCGILDGIITKVGCRQKQVGRKLYKNNVASRAPIASYLNFKGQSLHDRNFDASLKMKSAQLGVDYFIAWDFDVVQIDELHEVNNIKDVRLGNCLVNFLSITFVHFMHEKLLSQISMPNLSHQSYLKVCACLQNFYS